MDAPKEPGVLVRNVYKNGITISLLEAEHEEYIRAARSSHKDLQMAVAALSNVFEVTKRLYRAGEIDVLQVRTIGNTIRDAIKIHPDMPDVSPVFRDLEDDIADFSVVLSRTAGVNNSTLNRYLRNQ